VGRRAAPDPAVWTVLGDRQAPGSIDAATAATLARESKQRFAILSSQLALALSSAMLQPASTTGHSGFDVALEGTYGGVDADPVGAAPPLGFTSRVWPTRSVEPAALTTAGVHARKALPFSIELGGRLTSLIQSSYVAAQGELKWAIHEGFRKTPDVALRVAYTRLFGQREWNLSSTELDLLVSKRWGVSAVTSFTPYVAARYAWVNASSDMLDFGPLPATPPPDVFDQQRSFASFPKLRVGLYRTTLGLRMTASVVSLALEATYFAGKTEGGAADPSRDAYGEFRLASSLSTAFKLGWEF
jgi:hypothetical protein